MNQPDYNLCNQSKDAQDQAAADTLACYWLHLKATGQIKRHDINKRLAGLTNGHRENVRAALNRNQHKYKDSSNAK